MKGTLTFHLPLQRGPQTPPRATLVVRRVAEDQFHAGLSVCAGVDQCVKRVGRAIAIERLGGRPIQASQAEDLITQVITALDRIHNNRSGTITTLYLNDLSHVQGRIATMRVE